MSQTTQTLPTPPPGFQWVNINQKNELMYATGIKELSKEHVTGYENLNRYSSSIPDAVGMTQIKANILITNRKKAEENLQKPKKSKPLFISVAVITVAAICAGIIAMFINPFFALIPLIIAFIGVVVLAYTHLLRDSSPAYIESEKRHINTINKALEDLYRSTSSHIGDCLYQWPIMSQYVSGTVKALMKHNIDSIYEDAGFVCDGLTTQLKKS